MPLTVNDREDGREVFSATATNDAIHTWCNKLDSLKPFVNLHITSRLDYITRRSLRVYDIHSQDGGTLS